MCWCALWRQSWSTLVISYYTEAARRHTSFSFLCCIVTVYCILYTHVNSTSHPLILPDRASLNLLTLKPQGFSMVFPFTYQVGVIKNPLKHPSDPQLPAPKIHPESQIYSIAGAAIGFMARKMVANSHNKNHPVQFPNRSILWVKNFEP